MVAGYDFEDKLEERIVLSGQSTRGQECCALKTRPSSSVWPNFSKPAPSPTSSSPAEAGSTSPGIPSPHPAISSGSIITFAHKPLTQKGPASAIQCQAIRFKSTREQASCAQTHGDPKNLRQNLVTLGIISYLCTVISNL